MDNKQKGRFVKQSAFDRFAAWVFERLGSGMFGSFFTSYDKRNESYLGSVEKLKKKENHSRRGKVRKGISRLIERSVFVNVFPKIPQFLLRMATRDYGIVLFVMGAVVSVLYPLKRYMSLIDISFSTFIAGILVSVCSIPLFFSAKSFSRDILSSKLMKKIVFDFCGARENTFRIAAEKPKFTWSNVSFFVGILLGVLSCFVSPLKIILTVFIALLAYSVLTTPEMGIVILIFAAPFASTGVLVASVLYISVCYIIKCVIGKRTFKFEYMDLWVVIVMLMLLLGGIVSVDRGASIKTALVDLALVLSYFIISNLIRSKEWYSRCIVSLVSSSLVVLIIAAVEFILGKLSAVLPDVSFFATSGEFLSSSFCSPAALSRYIVMALPFIFTYMITKRDGLPKFGGFVLIVLSVWVLTMTGSAESIIGCLAAIMLLLLIYNKKFIYLLISLIVGLPILYFALPTPLTEAALSHLGFYDISMDVKLPILRRAFLVMMEHPFGVGLGKAPFANVSGLEDAGNLYMQIGTEAGFLALLAFIAFAVVFAKLVFSYCSKPKNRFRKTSCSAGFAAVVGILTTGLFDTVSSDKSIFLLFFAAIALSFAYVKIEREEEIPKTTMVDISSASVDIALSIDSGYDNLPKRKYVHAPKVKPEKIKTDSILKEFESDDDIIKITPDTESEENKNDESEKHE